MNNPSNGRPRGPPSGAFSNAGPRPPPVNVNGGLQTPGSTPGSALSRAEKFEDEKRRIIESAFVKKDPDGAGIDLGELRIYNDIIY